MVVCRFTIAEQFAGVRTGAPCMITSGAYAGHAALFIRVWDEVGSVDIEVNVRIVPGSHPLHDFEGPDDYQRIMVHPSGLVVAPELNAYDGIERDPHTGVAVGGVLNDVADSDPDEPWDGVPPGVPSVPPGGRYYYVDETGHQWSAMTGPPPGAEGRFFAVQFAAPSPISLSFTRARDAAEAASRSDAQVTETGVVAALCPDAVSQETASPGAPSRTDTASVSGAAPRDGVARSSWDSTSSWGTPRDGVARSDTAPPASSWGTRPGTAPPASSWGTPREGVARSSWNDTDLGSPGSAQTLANRRARSDPVHGWSIYRGTGSDPTPGSSADAVPRVDAPAPVPIVEGVAALEISTESTPLVIASDDESEEGCDSESKRG
eukprot:scaffold125652_cov37-Attheya_sp.AAC.1